MFALGSLPKDIHRQRAVILVSVGVYELVMALFGVTTNFVLSHLFFAITGGLVLRFRELRQYRALRPV